MGCPGDDGAAAVARGPAAGPECAGAAAAGEAWVLTAWRAGGFRPPPGPGASVATPGNVSHGDGRGPGRGGAAAEQ
eukprot:7636469-Alexandrium_andersonii.AAC.1